MDCYKMELLPNLAYSLESSRGALSFFVPFLKGHGEKLKHL